MATEGDLAKKYLPRWAITNGVTTPALVRERLSLMGIPHKHSSMTLGPPLLPVMLPELAVEILSHIRDVRILKAILCSNRFFAQVSRDQTMLWKRLILKWVQVPLPRLEESFDLRKAYWGLLKVPVVFDEVLDLNLLRSCGTLGLPLGEVSLPLATLVFENLEQVYSSILSPFNYEITDWICTYSSPEVIMFYIEVAKSKNYTIDPSWLRSLFTRPLELLETVLAVLPTPLAKQSLYQLFLKGLSSFSLDHSLLVLEKILSLEAEREKETFLWLLRCLRDYEEVKFFLEVVYKDRWKFLATNGEIAKELTYALGWARNAVEFCKIFKYLRLERSYMIFFDFSTRFLSVPLLEFLDSIGDPYRQKLKKTFKYLVNLEMREEFDYIISEIDHYPLAIRQDLIECLLSKEDLEWKKRVYPLCEKLPRPRFFSIILKKLLIEGDRETLDYLHTHHPLLLVPKKSDQRKRRYKAIRELIIPDNVSLEKYFPKIAS